MTHDETDGRPTGQLVVGPEVVDVGGAYALCMITTSCLEGELSRSCFTMDERLLL